MKQRAIKCEHYATLRAIGMSYSARYASISKLVSNCEVNRPYLWAGYYVLSMSRTFPGYCETVLDYLTPQQIDEAIEDIARDIEIWQR